MTPNQKQRKQVTSEAIERALKQHGRDALSTEIGDSAVYHSRHIADTYDFDWTIHEEEHVYDEVFSQGLGKPD